MSILLYPHGGSGNHGCEAIVRTTSNILNKAVNEDSILLASYNKKQDIYYGIDTIDEYIEFSQPSTYSISNIIGKFHNDIFKKFSIRNKIATKNIIKKINKLTLCISIGGDIYSYKGVIPYNTLAINKIARQKARCLILWGCSIGRECLNDYIIDDLKSYDLIIVRESMTYDNLIQINPNTKLYPDPAFILECFQKIIPLE